jgi:flagellar export protein FliJ
MAFRFTLASVLGFRLSIEKREELALKQILFEIARTHHQIEHLSAEISRAQQALNESLKQTLPAFHLQTMLNDVNAIVDRKKALVESLVPLERKRVTQLEAYYAAHRGRRTLSDMKTRQREAYDIARAKAEQKLVDDLFAARAQRG